jgi:hypothetical protein
MNRFLATFIPYEKLRILDLGVNVNYWQLIKLKSQVKLLEVDL